MTCPRLSGRSWSLCCQCPRVKDGPVGQSIRKGTTVPTTPSQRLPRRAALVATVLAVGLGAAGCATPSATAGGEAGGKPVIRIAYQKFPSGDLVVKNQKLLEKALPKYTIEWKAFDSGASINTAFIAKAIDIGAIGSRPVARGLSDPLNIPYSVAYVLDVAGENEALVARKEVGVSTVAGLKGKRIATPFASTSHYSLIAALDHEGLSDTDVTLVDLQPQDILAAWKRGDIDAAYVWLPVLDELRADGTTLVTSADVAHWGKPTLDLGVVSNALAAKHPDVVDAWRTAETAGTTLIREKPEEAAKAVAAELGISPEDAAGQLSQGVFLSPEEQSSADWLGTDGSPGALASNLHDAASFLAELKKIPAAPAEDVFSKAIYTKGLPGALGG
ncbi:MAG: ABC transporter substrate-binding protein [Tetrasphaera sp.]|nr:ABC transporter substrate-binding protein [Tetrasphaera sp.]